MLLKELTQLWGISGVETNVSDFIAKKVMDKADSIKRDALGNLIVLKRGSAPDGQRRRIMAAAHMDEIGLCVVKILDNGMIKVRRVGGVSPYIAYMNRVQFQNGVFGLVASTEKIQTLQPTDHDKLYVDIGATSKEEAQRSITVGDYAVFCGDYTELPGRNVMAKAFDDRAGCYILAEALLRMGTPYHDVYFVFTIQEEVGLFGATTSAEGIRPDLGLAVDITGAFDIPGDEYGNPTLGKGAAIKVNDASVLCDQALTKAMVNCAEKHGIAYQLDPLPNGGTDAGGINKSCAGVKAVGISIPTRYGHAPCSIVNLDDVESCVQLLEKYVSEPLNIVVEEILK